MKTVTAIGTYTHPETKVDVNYNFDYPVIESVQDAIDNLGEDKVKSTIQRMLKIDANNVAREKAKSANGHSTRKVMTEEEKAQAKAQRASDRELLNAIKAKGLTAADLASL